jgi:hypothetical protein
MSTLEVTNRILRYEGEIYNIAQITSHRVVYVKRRPPRVHLRLTLFLLAIASLAGGFAWFVFLGSADLPISTKPLEFSAQIAVLVASISGGAVGISVGGRFGIALLNALSPRTALHLRLANGDSRVFISKDTEKLLEISDAIEDAMNNPNVTMSFHGANIHVENSENVVIGGNFR